MADSSPLALLFHSTGHCPGKIPHLTWTTVADSCSSPYLWGGDGPSPGMMCPRTTEVHGHAQADEKLIKPTPLFEVRKSGAVFVIRHFRGSARLPMGNREKSQMRLP